MQNGIRSMKVLLKHMSITNRTNKDIRLSKLTEKTKGEDRIGEEAFTILGAKGTKFKKASKIMV